MELNITRMDSEQLSYKTKMALLDIILESGKDGKPFKLPNEDELSQRLGVSRNALRDALMSLEDMGIVTRRRSKGTIANPQIASANCRLDASPELDRMIEGAGYKARVKTLSLGYSFDDQNSFSDDPNYLVVDKLFFANDVPVAYCSDRLPAKYTEQAGDSILRLKEISHYRFLEEYCGTSLAYTMAQIDPVLPEPWLAELMQVPATEPLLLMDDYGYNYDHELVAHSSIYFKRGILDLKFLRKSW